MWSLKPLNTKDYNFGEAGAFWSNEQKEKQQISGAYVVINQSNKCTQKETTPDLSVLLFIEN